MSFLFFFNDTAPTEIYTLSLHDALPILQRPMSMAEFAGPEVHTVDTKLLIQDTHVHVPMYGLIAAALGDRKSTRLNSSHTVISYAVFCLKKKKIIIIDHEDTR